MQVYNNIAVKLPWVYIIYDVTVCTFTMGVDDLPVGITMGVYDITVGGFTMGVYDLPVGTAEPVKRDVGRQPD